MSAASSISATGSPHFRWGTQRDDLIGLRVTGFERRVTIAFIVTADAVLIEGIFYGAGTSGRVSRSHVAMEISARWLIAILILILSLGNSLPGLRRSMELHGR
jgi:hypothetical protein